MVDENSETNSQSMRMSQSSISSVQNLSRRRTRSRIFDIKAINPKKFVEGILNFLLINDIAHYLDPNIFLVMY